MQEYIEVILNISSAALKPYKIQSIAVVVNPNTI